MKQNKRNETDGKRIEMLIKKIVPLCFALCLVLSSCGARETEKTNTVYTTFYAVYDLTKQIAGDKADVVQLVPSGSGAHDYEPTAADIAKLSEAKALIYCGTVDTYIDGIKETVGKAGVKTLDTAAAANIAEDAGDPHIWLDPDNALAQMTAIAELLSELDPSNSAYYSSRLSTASDNIEELKGEIEGLKATAVKHDIIVSHAAYGYLCDCLGITQHAAESGAGEGADPTAKQMAELTELAKANNINIIFAQRNESDKTARALASEIGGDVMLLDPLETDTGSGNYFDVMRRNILALGTALS